MHTVNDFYCCETLQTWIKDQKCPVYYCAKRRDYGISTPEALVKKYEMYDCYRLNFCPACGIKVPENLIDAWYDVLQQECGLDDPVFNPEQNKRIPTEFLTDEWWKKRGW